MHEESEVQGGRMKQGSLSTVLAASAMLGGFGWPMPPLRGHKAPRTLTQDDHDRIAAAKAKQEKRAAKKAENIRRSEAGKLKK